MREIVSAIDCLADGSDIDPRQTWCACHQQPFQLTTPTLKMSLVSELFKHVIKDRHRLRERHVMSEIGDLYCGKASAKTGTE
jgi:hypothetical protein